MNITSHEVISNGETFEPLLQLTVVMPLSLVSEPQAVDSAELRQIIGTELIEAWQRHIARVGPKP